MTTIFSGHIDGYDDLAPGLREIATRLDRRDGETSGRRHDDEPPRKPRPPRPPSGVMWELAKIVLPAALAFGGAWMSMHDQITDMRGDIKALSQQVNDIKTMLGIGVFQGRR